MCRMSRTGTRLSERTQTSTRIGKVLVHSISHEPHRQEGCRTGVFEAWKTPELSVQRRSSTLVAGHQSDHHGITLRCPEIPWGHMLGPALPRGSCRRPERDGKQRLPQLAPRALTPPPPLLVCCITYNHLCSMPPPQSHLAGGGDQGPEREPRAFAFRPLSLIPGLGVSLQGGMSRQARGKREHDQGGDIHKHNFEKVRSAIQTGPTLE